MRVVRSDEHQRSLLDDLVLTVDIMYRAPPEYKEQLVEFVAMNRVRVVYIVLLYDAHARHARVIWQREPRYRHAITSFDII